jgi:hypothetical protein
MSFLKKENGENISKDELKDLIMKALKNAPKEKKNELHLLMLVDVLKKFAKNNTDKELKNYLIGVTKIVIENKIPYGKYEEEIIQAINRIERENLDELTKICLWELIKITLVDKRAERKESPLLILFFMLEELSKDKPDEIVYENLSTLLLMIGYEGIDLNKYSEEIKYRMKNIPEKNYNDVKADFLILDNLLKINRNMQSFEPKGRFGYDTENPIMTKSIGEEYRYLDNLESENGEPINYRRFCSLNVKDFPNPVDAYEITNAITNEKICNLHIYGYSHETSQVAPEGFRLKHK